jgi:hypothetical protein
MMRSLRLTPCLLMTATLCVGGAGPPRASAGPDEGHRAAEVKLLAAPEGGLQPQAAIDDRGVIHLVYFKGDPAGGDLFYARLEPGAERFSAPVRVNSQPGSAIAIGTIRGGQIAVGRGGRIHVAWNGSNVARPKNPFGSNPMLYTRSDQGGRGFEPQRNLMQRTSALDGGGTVAADRTGNVYVAWHGRTEDAGPGESGRRMWVVRSRDDGATFSAEEPTLESQSGACACCGTRALADRDGTLHLLYRAATGGVDRDMYLLSSEDHAGHFRGISIHPWRAEICPMSSATLADSEPGVLAAWETRGQVYFSRVDQRTHRAGPPISPPGGRGDRKHPAVAGNAQGETILVWTEGTGWQKGGSLAWQVFDRAGHPTALSGFKKDAIPVWSLATVVARPDGGFTIITSRLSDEPKTASQPRRDRMIGRAAAVFHPRVARLARQLDEARDVADAAKTARELLLLDSEVARDVVANYAARSPLRGFDRAHRVLVILDGSKGWVNYTMASDPPVVKTDKPSGIPPALERQLEKESLKFAARHSWKLRMNPPVPWAAAFRLPDGAVMADEGGGGDTVSYLLIPQDDKRYHYLAFTFRGLDFEVAAIRDVKDAQLRRWKASDWWPKEWR